MRIRRISQPAEHLGKRGSVWPGLTEFWLRLSREDSAAIRSAQISRFTNSAGRLEQTPTTALPPPMSKYFVRLEGHHLAQTIEARSECVRNSDGDDGPLQRRWLVGRAQSPCCRMAMICSSLCHVHSFPAQHVIAADIGSVTSLVQENSHSKWFSF